MSQKSDKAMTNSEQQYIDLYKNYSEVIKANSAEALNAPRDMAFGHFMSMGFPTQKKEEYKYTDVQKAFAPDYGLNIKRIEIPTDPFEAFKCNVPNLSTLLYFVVNDLCYKDNPPLKDDNGIFLGSIKQAPEQARETFSRLYAKNANTATDAITALNTALAQDAFMVYVPRNRRLNKTLQVINLLHSKIDLMVNRRVMIVLEEGADATLLFCDHAMDSVRFLATQVTEIYCADNSHLDMYELEENHILCTRFSNTYVTVGNDCNVSLNNITLYNGNTRNTVRVKLEGEHSEVTLNGCVIADKNQKVDNNTLIEHCVPNCTSNELYRYVIDDSATGAFAGRILVHPGAQNTVSQETNANLCATKEARMYSQPMLEIYADDVKCSHGSTVGVLDENALFYMQQRGIPADEARMLLKFAFISQVCEKIKLEPLRERLNYLVNKRFRGQLSKCTGCSLCK